MVWLSCYFHINLFLPIQKIPSSVWTVDYAYSSARVAGMHIRRCLLTYILGDVLCFMPWFLYVSFVTFDPSFENSKGVIYVYGDILCEW